MSPDDSLEVIRSESALGADLIGFNIKDVHPSQIEKIRRAWLDHIVLRIRGQSFDDDHHLAFATLLGEVSVPVRVTNTGTSLHGRHPAISVISNIKSDGKAIGSLGDGDLVWHTDMSFVERPPAGSLLHAFEVPNDGGDTQFLNMYLVYEMLPLELKRAIVSLTINHENIHGSDLGVRSGVTDPNSDDPRDYPGVVHPIVRTHPETGRDALYLGRRINAYIPGLPLDESEDLINLLWKCVEASPFTWTQHWQAGDLIIWDNRCSMHRRDAFDPRDRRLMHRAVVGAEAPFYGRLCSASG